VQLPFVGLKSNKQNSSVGIIGVASVCLHKKKIGEKYWKNKLKKLEKKTKNKKKGTQLKKRTKKMDIIIIIAVKN